MFRGGGGGGRERGYLRIMGTSDLLKKKNREKKERKLKVNIIIIILNKILVRFTVCLWLSFFFRL